MNPIYARIKDLRIKNRYSQTDMAARLELNQTSYGKLERGETQLTIERLEQLANIFSITPKELMFPEEPGEVIERQRGKELLEKLETQIELLQKEVQVADRQRKVDQEYIEIATQQHSLLVELFAHMDTENIRQIQDTLRAVAQDKGQDNRRDIALLRLLNLINEGQEVKKQKAN